MALTNVFNNYLPNGYKYYSFLNLFEKNSKNIYEEIVLKNNKIKKK